MINCTCVTWQSSKEQRRHCQRPKTHQSIDNRTRGWKHKINKQLQSLQSLKRFHNMSKHPMISAQGSTLDIRKEGVSTNTIILHKLISCHHLDHDLVWVLDIMFTTAYAHEDQHMTFLRPMGNCTQVPQVMRNLQHIEWVPMMDRDPLMTEEGAYWENKSF